MKFFYRGIGIFCMVALVSLAAVWTSNKYYTAINSADDAYNNSLRGQISDFYDTQDGNKSIIDGNTQGNISGSLANKNGSAGGSAVDDTQAPVFNSGYEAYVYAEAKLKRVKGLQIEITGNADAGITNQQVRSIVKRDSKTNKVFYEAVSISSFMKTGMQCFYDGRIFSRRYASSVSSLTSVSYGTWEVINYNSYLTGYGVRLDELNYVVNESTILKETGFKTPEQNSNNLYTFTLSLAPAAGVNYAKAIRSNAGADDYPNFKSIELDVTINKDGNFVQIIYREVYGIKVAVYNATVHTNITQSFKVVGGNVVVEDI